MTANQIRNAPTKRGTLALVVVAMLAVAGGLPLVLRLVLVKPSHAPDLMSEHRDAVARVEALWDGAEARPTAAQPDVGVNPDHRRVDSHVVRERSAGPETDIEWETIPRSSWAFAARVRANPGLLRAEELFRHVELNPLDRHVDRRLREEFAFALARMLATVEPATRLLEETRQRELTALADSGLARAVRRQPQGLAVPKAALRGGTVLLRGGTNHVLHWATPEMLPKTQAVQEYVTYEGINIGGAIVNWFERRGICPVGQAAKVLAAVVK